MSRHSFTAAALFFAVIAGAIAADAPNTGAALRYVSDHRAELGLSDSDLADVVVTDAYVSDHTGVSHVYLRQRYQGIEVYGANVNVNVARDGGVLSAGSDFVPNLASKVNLTAPVLDAVAAAQAAAAALDLLPIAPFQVLEDRGGPARETVLSGGGVSLSTIPAKLVYQPVDGSVRLAWDVEIEEMTQQHYWSLRVDAETGALLSKDDFVDRDDFGSPSREGGASSDSPGTTTSSAALPMSVDGVPDGSSYRVFPQPVESPSHGARSLVSDPADSTSSPFGWHDTNAAAGPEFTTPRGNNVHAYCDTVGDGVPDPGSEPDGGASLDFDFPFDPADEPLEYRPFAVTNLFYWNNVIHDVFYRYGFNEASGNFQVNNYGRGGVGNDDVRAEAQDGGGTNNANFSTPVDGSRPRMQMFLWQPAYPNAVTVNPPSAIAGSYDATDAQFGAPAPPTGITGNIALVNDGVGVPADACEPLVGFPPGSIALLERGTCAFTIKVLNAQNAGAVAAIVHNNVPGGPAIRMGFATTPTPDANAARVVIPSVMVSYNDGQLFRANLPLNGTVRRKTESEPLRDGDLDSGIITHEYGHGISNRLTGGPQNVSCLNNPEQMGEGWSDWLGLVLTARAGDTATQNRGVGSYALYQPPDGFGIRPTPYTTNMSVNPATYDTIKTAAVPHGVGYVWSSMLWEVYWNLVGAYGFNPDVYGHWTSGGNNLAIQLVMDGMKLQKCSPGFVDGRNAILLADQVLTGGENQCYIWNGFAKRGLGVSAIQGSSTSVTDGTQAFDVPSQCLAGIAVDPPSLSATQLANTRTTQTLRIQNGTLGGGANLTWTITEAASSCAAPSDLPWLSVSSAGGTTVPGGTSSVAVTFDSAGLSAPASRSGKLCVSSNDPARPLIEVPVSLAVIYDFRGFFGTVKNPPAVNKTAPGSTVPVQFSLSGNKGMSIFESGSPSSVEIDCDTKGPIGAAEPTLGSLSYDAASDRYKYQWKTQGDWAAGSCRELTLRLNDGTTHRALFQFK